MPGHPWFCADCLANLANLAEKALAIGKSRWGVGSTPLSEPIRSRLAADAAAQREMLR
jgi:hypothetical protein